MGACGHRIASGNNVSRPVFVSERQRAIMPFLSCLVRIAHPGAESNSMGSLLPFRGWPKEALARQRFPTPPSAVALYFKAGWKHTGAKPKRS
jgi:hypothetical protein